MVKKITSYLDEDGVILPKLSQTAKESLHSSDPRFERLKSKEDLLEQDYAYGDTWDEASLSGESEHQASAQFEKLEKTIQKAIESLDGRVFPKLNWSSPQDAAWLFGSLSCR